MHHDAPSLWPALAPAVVGLGGDLSDSELSVDELLGRYLHTVKGDSFLAWHGLVTVGVLHSRLVVPVEHDDYHAVDAYQQLAVRLALVRAVSTDSMCAQLADAVALRDRLPQVGLCLRDGLITHPQFRKTVAWTELADGQPYMPELDAEIATTIRAGAGRAFSMQQLRDRVNRLLFRRDPDAVRARRELAKEQRAMFTQPGSDGMATIGATMTAENVRIAAAHVHALAKAVCPKDPRSFGARTSDAMYALLTQTPFDCQCDDPERCTSNIPDLSDTPVPVYVNPRTVIQVVMNHSTLHGEDDEPGWLDGHGTISADHARDLATRKDAAIRVVNPDSAPRPAAQKSDPYRPTTLADTYVRIRDGHSTVPGNHTGAWDCDIDHVNEYSFTDPASGGRTHPDGLGVKDRFFHIVKTHGDWLDDLDIDEQGRAYPVFYTPEGVEIRGHPGLGIDLFPGLATIKFTEPEPPPGVGNPTATSGGDGEPPERKKTRLEYKHQRRRDERARNKKRRQQRDHADGDPPF